MNSTSDTTGTTKNALLRLVDSTDVAVVGGKASALGVMLRAGFRVPGGFVLSSGAFRNMNPLIENMLLNAFDKLDSRFVAVRSSAINEDGKDAAWAGQLDTFLNCQREELIQKIKDCWESVGSERAESYAAQKGMERTQVAVIVQEMVDSEVSGVAFSAHPVTGNTAQVVIEAGLGLGEAVVSGHITPDTYIANKEDGRLLERYIAAQRSMLVRSADEKNTWRDTGPKGDAQKLTGEQIVDICRLSRELEILFKYPVDVEWAIKKNMLYILQCRPITTLA